MRNRDLPKQTTNLESIIASECRGEDAGLFSLVCFEGQSLAGQKENSLSHIIDKRYAVPLDLFFLVWTFPVVELEARPHQGGPQPQRMDPSTQQVNALPCLEPPRPAPTRRS